MSRNHYRNSMLAFPHTAQYGCAIERPRESRWAVILGCVVVGAVFAALLFFGVSE